ncbi:MAG: UvrD-helicase domain-containing protein [Desulfobacterales bacterium]|nr:UvrD-helicase domain-containing protein [Desulfobacterales bacterium]
MTRRAQRVVAEALAAAGRAQRCRATLRLPWSGTFHAIGNRLIRQYAQRLGLDPSFSVLDRGDAADLMDVVRHRLGFVEDREALPAQGHLPRHLLASHQQRSSRCGTRSRPRYPWCLDWEQQLTGLYRAYVEEKLAQQALDYDDLLLYWHVMTRRRRRWRREIGARFDHVLVDEYQDTNAAAGGDPAAAQARRRRRHRGGRRRAGDLLVPRRHGREHPRVPGAVLAAGARRRRWSRTTARRSRCSTPPTR